MNGKQTTPKSVYDGISRNLWMTRLFAALLLCLIVLVAVVVIKLPASPMRKVIRLLPTVGLPLLAIVRTWWNDDLLVTLAKARPARREEFPYYINCVESLAMGAGIPCPGIYVIDDPAPNALASGRDPAHAKICLTTGLLTMMNRLELEGVVAHELSHIRSCDTMLMTLVLAGVSILYSLTGLSRTATTRNLAASLRRPRTWIVLGGIVLLITALGSSITFQTGVLVFSVFAGMALLLFSLAMLRAVCMYVIPAAVSREREFLADSNAGLLTRFPDGLIGALTKISASGLKLRHGREVLSSILIVSPGDTMGDGVECMLLKKLFPRKLYALSPSVEVRIRRLEEMRAGQPATVGSADLAHS